MTGLDDIAKLRYGGGGRGPFQVLYFQGLDGGSPVIEWLESLRLRDRAAYAKGRSAIQRLGMQGHELRRPTADYLRDGIHELRFRVGRVQHRLLYFFHGRGVAVLVHGLTKERELPHFDIERALTRKRAFATDPERHTYTE